MKLKYISVFIICCIISVFCYSSSAQMVMDFSFTPAKMELETDFGYHFKNRTEFGAVHNEEKYYFNPKADKYTITYVYAAFPVYDELKFRVSYGFGYRRDIEIRLTYEYKWFYAEFGGSETEPIFFEIKFGF